MIYNTVDFMHPYLAQPTGVPEDRIIHAGRLLTCAFEDAPAVCVEAQLQAISYLRNVFEKWQDSSITPTMTVSHPRVLMPEISSPRVPAVQRQPAPTHPLAPSAPTPKQVLLSKGADQPVAHRTRSSRRPHNALVRQAPLAPYVDPTPFAYCTQLRTSLANTVNPALTACCIFLQVFLTMWEMPVRDHETGEYLTYQQLYKHPRLNSIWSTSYSNKVGHLWQGISVGPQGQGKRVNGTDTFHVIYYDNVLQN